MFRRSFVLFLLLVFTWIATAQAIIAPPDDMRTYRVILLANGPLVLAVHDLQATKAAAAVALPVGSLDDPDQHLGLAHFLEHMIFLGSRNYPEPGQFQAFVEAHGGRTNAMTSPQSTVYVLEVDPPALAEGLRRLTDTLAWPLLDPSFVDKERHAVHAEMESIKHDDGRRLAMLARSTLNPEHPASRFTVGNLETLADTPTSRLLDALRDFHNRWYSAPLLRVVLCGPQSLDELESLAREGFAAFPVRETAPPKIGFPAVAAAHKGIWVDMRPVRPLQLLRLDFVLPAQLHDPKTQPLHLLAAVAGTETPGSLVDELRQADLALGLSAGVDTESLRSDVLFSITIQLTDRGARMRQAVAARCFHFFQRLAQAPWQTYFQQYHKLNDIHFRFDPVGKGFDLVASLAQRLHIYPPEDILYGPYRMDGLDIERLATAISLLTPENARIFSVDTTAQTTQTDRFYGTAYAISPVARDLLAAAPSGSGLPAANPFVPTDLSLRPLPQRSAPEPIYAARGIRAWWMPTHEVLQPKISLLVRITGLGVEDEDLASMALFTEAWQQAMAGIIFQAAEAGLHMDLSPSGPAAELRIHGLRQHALELLRAALTTWQAPLSDQRFAQAKAQRLRDLKGEESQRVFGQAMRQLGRSLRAPAPSTQALQTATAKLTLPKLERWRRKALAAAAFQVFVGGNLTQQEAHDMVQRLADMVGYRDTAPTALRRLAPLPGHTATIQRQVPLDDSAAVGAALTEATPKTRAAATVLAELISSPLYTALRTEAQLGYVVTAFPISNLHQAGLGMGIQSPVASPRELTRQIAAFVHDFPIASLAEHFDGVRRGAIASLRTPPQTILQELDPWEEDFRSANPRWDGRTSLIQALEQLSWEETLGFWNQIVGAGQGTWIWVELEGKRHPGFSSVPRPFSDATEALRHMPTVVQPPLW